jgi:hypothetical protein
MIAEAALERLPAPLAAALRNHGRPYYLGSVAPDFPYFQVLMGYRGLAMNSQAAAITHHLEETLLHWVGGLPKGEGGAWAGRFHDQGARGLLQSWMDRVPEESDGSLRSAGVAAFLMGMLSHVAADESLHPSVEADSGDPLSFEGRSRHRQIETELDFRLLCLRQHPGLEAYPADLAARWVGHPGDEAGFFPGWLAQGLAACSGIPEKTWASWSAGFRRGLALLDHPMSPMVAAQRGAMATGWQREGDSYLERHVPAAERDVSAALAEARSPRALQEGIHA